MIEFRFIIYKNKTTKEDIHEYSLSSGYPFWQAKKVLEDESTPILQYRTVNGDKMWKDVQTVIEYRK